MKPPPFQYYAPANLPEVLELLEIYGEDARILAGGQSLVPDMNFRKVCPAVLIDINGLQELKNIESELECLIIGAGIRQAELGQSAELKEIFPIISHLLEYIGYAQTRNCGTLGGSLAYGDPAGELPAMALALDAEFELSSSAGVRWVSAKSFYTGPFETVLESNEMLTRIRIPRQSQKAHWAFAEQPVKTLGKAIMGIMIGVSLNIKYEVAGAHITTWGASDRPMRLYKVEKALLGQKISDISFEAAIQAVLAEINPPNDLHASSALRNHLAKVQFKRSLQKIVGSIF